MGRASRPGFLPHPIWAVGLTMASGVRPLQSPKPEETPLVGGRGACWTRAGAPRVELSVRRRARNTKCIVPASCLGLGVNFDRRELIVTLLLHRRSYVSVVFVIAQTQLKKSVPLWCLLGGEVAARRLRTRRGPSSGESARAVIQRPPLFAASVCRRLPGRGDGTMRGNRCLSPSPYL